MRIYLFQLLCITGEWDRALTQLSVVGELDPQAAPMVQTYKVVLQCEGERSKVFAGQQAPTVLGAPEPWVVQLITALRLDASGQHEKAFELRREALDLAPALPAHLDENDVEWVSDADQRLGPVAEAIVEGRYAWVPFGRIRALRVEPPADLRDQVWLPVHFTWDDGGTADGFIPTRYPNTTAQADPLLLLGRRTEWSGEGDLAVPYGQRVLITDQVEVALMDLRRLDFYPPVAAAAG